MPYQSLIKLFYWTALVNRHPYEAVDCIVKLGAKELNGTFETTILSSDSPDSYNDTRHPDRVAPEQMELKINKGQLSLPPHSLVIVLVDLE